MIVGSETMARKLYSEIVDRKTPGPCGSSNIPICVRFLNVRRYPESLLRIGKSSRRATLPCSH